MNHFKPFPVKSNDSFWAISGTFWPFWPMILDHNKNPFRSFAVKLNHPNSINSPKSHFWDIFGHIGHRAQFQNFPTYVNGGCYYNIIGIILDHFQPIQMIQIRAIVEKVIFVIFRYSGSRYLDKLLGPISEFKPHVLIVPDVTTR